MMRRGGPGLRQRRGTRVGSFALVLLAGLLPARLAASEPAVAGAFPGGVVRLIGHGWGPGVGMGQWGAFGYAAVRHETYRWILSHFYGGTTLAKLTNDPMITVAITANALPNGTAPVIVTSPSPFRFGPYSFPSGDAGKAVLDQATGSWTLYQGTDCAGTGGWKKLSAGLSDPVATPASLAAAAPADDLLTICLADGGRETVRGRVEAYADTGADTSGRASSRTLDTLPLEQYVADVVPSESSSGWGEVGGAGPQGEEWGFQELEAQAVAARTYALAYEADGGWLGYADICDDGDCQSDPGIGNESALATAAVADTAGQYLVLDGKPAVTQYSASTGGYTVASEFPAVADAGDGVCLKNTGYWTCNPAHDWSASIPVSRLEAAFPTLGALSAIAVTKRTGLGQWGGRAETVELVGSSGTVRVTGSAFQVRFGLDSNWFRFASSGLQPPAPGIGPSSFARLGPATGPLPLRR